VHVHARMQLTVELYGMTSFHLVGTEHCESLLTWYLFTEASKLHAKCCQGDHRTSKWIGCHGQSCILLQP